MSEAPTRTSPHMAIVGAGAMAEAMLVGMLARHVVAADSVVCSHPRAERRAALMSRHGVHTDASNAATIVGADLIILAIKPQMLEAVLPELRPVLRPHQIVLSVIAGATTRALGAGLEHPAIVRAMPNTPAQIAQGVTVWFATESVSQPSRARVREVLAALGQEIEVPDERQVAMATALSGTGPTFIFLFIEALVDAGVHLGFARHVARDLVLGTLRGSADFALQSGRHPAELRDMVTSPGGTSAEALYRLERGGLRTVVSDAVWAAFERTLALEASLEGRTDRASTRLPPR